MQRPGPVATPLHELTEPISLVSFFSPEPNDAMAAVGFHSYWDGCFAGRSAPLGRVPAEVVHAAFYSFTAGEVARHIPEVWETTTPEVAHAARQRGCVAALRRILGDLADSPELARAADLLARASTSAPTEGRVMYAGCARCLYPRSPWPGCGTRPTCSASTAGTAMSLPCSPSRSAAPRPPCSALSTRASTRRSRSAGSTTCPRPAWRRSWAVCAIGGWSIPRGGSPILGEIQGPDRGTDRRPGRGSLRTAVAVRARPADRPARSDLRETPRSPRDSLMKTGSRRGRECRHGQGERCR